MRAPTCGAARFVALLAAHCAACGGGHSTGADTDDTDTITDSGSDFDAGSDSGTAMTPADYTDPTLIEWVEIDGGTYLQGSVDPSIPYVSYDETPAHDVTVSPFEMMKTEVTTSQYAQCVLDGACVEPMTAHGDTVAVNCNWLVWGREDHPVNCVYVWDAEAYCAWLGARLPSESEWEFAARSRGGDNEYPGGDAPATCDYAVINMPYEDVGCGTGHTWPVCSKSAGNTEQGLCDLAGNVKEWMPDCYYGDYYGAPSDGSAWTTGSCETQVLRGGSYVSTPTSVRTRTRSDNPSYGRSDAYGFRCARSEE